MIKHWVGNRLKISRFLAKEKQYTNVNSFWLDLIKTSKIRKQQNLLKNFCFLNYFIKEINKISKTNYLMISNKYSIFNSSKQAHALINNANYLNLCNEAELKQVVTNKHDFELICASKALLNFKMLDIAIDFFYKNKIQLSAVNLRHYFYSLQILDSLKTQQKISILEIGGGGGNLYKILSLQLQQRIIRYTVIDIPEFLILNAFGNQFSGKKILFPNSKTDISSNNSDLFISASEYSQIFQNNTSLRFDLVINTHSFMEMSNDTINEYFDLIYIRANPYCLFFQTNFTQYSMPQMDGTLKENNPRNYLFRTDDKVLYEGDDPFTAYISSHLGYKQLRQSFTSIRNINMN